jgi:hypothetical protein
MKTIDTNQRARFTARFRGTAIEPGRAVRPGASALQAR